MFKKKKYDMYIEKPIEKKDNDLFGIDSYSDIIKDAIKKEAKFIAIDGEFGSGKSSIINILKEKYKRDILFKKIKFVDINFLNINKNIDEENSEEKQSNINFYHRYFANQVANDICKNPYSIEKLFYNSFISIATTKNNGHRLWKIVIDKILLILISFITIMITYKSFLTNIKSLIPINDIFMPLLPWAIYITFILIIIYGYGIYKPEKQAISPMLDVDKTRNNLLKSVQSYIKSNSTLVFLIDDLDRLETKIQQDIISLLYNEYYPLSKQIRNIKFCFIFMINIEKIKDYDDIHKDDKKVEFDYKKIFDFILKVSNNQKFIIRDYIYNCFSHGTLKEVIDNCKHKEFLIGFIANSYDNVRVLKHIFNEIINKYRYLDNKKDFQINYDQLVMLTVLNDKYDTNQLSVAINQYFKGNKDSKISNALYEALEKKIIDKNYYLYLYNFSKKDALLNDAENELNDILIKVENTELNEEDIICVNKIINENKDIRLRKIYEEIFQYLSKKGKLALLTNTRFFEFIFVENPKIQGLDIDIFKNLYQNKYGQQVYLNIQKNSNLFDMQKLNECICSKLIEKNNTYIEDASDENYIQLENEVIAFLKNMKDSVLQYNNLKIFDNLGILSKDIFSEMFDKNNYGWYLYHNNIIKYENICDKLNVSTLEKLIMLDNKEIRDNIRVNLLGKDLHYDQIHAILSNDKIKIDIKKLYLKLSNDNYCVPFEDIIYLIENYGYYTEADNIINKSIDKNSKSVYEYINKNNIEISTNIINKFSSISNKYCWKDKYNEKFAKNNKWVLYVYSKIKRNNLFLIPKKYMNNKECISKALDIYCKVKLNMYKIDKNLASIFLKDEYMDILIKELNNNKIGQLSEFMSDTNIDNALIKIENNNLVNEYCNIISDSNYKISLQFLNKFNNKFYDKLLNSQYKRKLTKKIKKMI